MLPMFFVCFLLFFFFKLQLLSNSNKVEESPVKSGNAAIVP